MSGDLLGQALVYAATGWRVFPTRPNANPCPQAADCPCKRPLTEHGFQDATTDPAVIRQQWRSWPAANVAIVTGAPGPDVLDVDVATEGSGWAGFNRQSGSAEAQPVSQRAGLLGLTACKVKRC